MKRMLLVAALLIVPFVGLKAESLMWKAEKGSEVVYIGGTIHLLRESDYPLPEDFDFAFGKADILVLEADLGLMGQLETQQKIMAGGMYPAGQGLDKVLSEEAYNSLAAYCESFGLSISTLNQLKPSLLLLMMLGNELQKMEVNPEYGIDLYYYGRAIDEGKELAYLETVDEQIEYILSMGEGKESEFVLSAISDLHNIREEIDKIILLWKTGDDENLADLLISAVKNDYPELYKTFIKDRNERWLPEIEAFFLTEEDELVLVGAGHLVGDDSVISLLQKRGYKVEKLR